MTGLNHTLTGVVIAVTVQNPIIAPLLACLSHFILDTVPHFGGLDWFETWGKKLKILSFIDGLLCVAAIFIASILFPQHTIVILLCAAAATLPDWLWILYYKYKIRHAFFRFHLDIQKFERPWGAYVEACYMLLCVFTLGILL